MKIHVTLREIILEVDKTADFAKAVESAKQTVQMLVDAEEAVQKLQLATANAAKNLGKRNPPTK